MRIVTDPDTGEVFETLPDNLRGLDPYDYADAKRAIYNAHLQRRQTEKEYTSAIEERANREREYRRDLATECLRAKTEHGATLAETIAKATQTVGESRLQLQIAEGRVFTCLERLRLCSEDRASLHRLIEWSRSLEENRG